jgi:predicted nucleotidyltransferase
LSLTESIIEELKTRHGCHTIILYGSRARDEHNDSSDYDVLGVRPAGEREHDAREFEGGYLDAFIYSEPALATLEPDMIRLRSGRVLLEKNGSGRQLIARANELFAAGPKPLPEQEARALRAWVVKTLSRISRGGPEDVEANYRRVWLLHDLLELYFKLRTQWYLGPKEALLWLRQNDPAAYAAFEAALRTDASRGALRVLADRVLTT